MVIAWQYTNATVLRQPGRLIECECFYSRNINVSGFIPLNCMMYYTFQEMAGHGSSFKMSREYGNELTTIRNTVTGKERGVKL